MGIDPVGHQGVNSGIAAAINSGYEDVSASHEITACEHRILNFEGLAVFVAQFGLLLKIQSASIRQVNQPRGRVPYSQAK